MPSASSVAPSEPAIPSPAIPRRPSSFAPLGSDSLDAEESTSVVDAVEVAQLRRRMRQSSQRLRAVGAGDRPAADAPSPTPPADEVPITPIKPHRASRKQTLVFAPAQPRPASTASTPPTAPAAEPVESPPASAVTPAARAPKVPLPFPAKRLPTPAARVLPKVPAPRAAALPTPASTRDVEPMREIPRAEPIEAPTASSIAIEEEAEPVTIDAQEAELAPIEAPPIAPRAELDTPHAIDAHARATPIDATSERLASIEPPPRIAPEPLPPIAPRPPHRTPMPISAMEVTPIIQLPPEPSIAAPSRSRGRLVALAIGGVIVIAGVVAIAAGIAWQASSSATSPIVAVPSAPTPAPQVVPPPLPSAPPVPPTPTAAPAPAPTAFGPTPEGPLDGEDADLDVAAFAIQPARRPAGRREEFALITRRLREATAARQRDLLDDASTAYREVLAIDPSNGRATAGLAYVHLERDELPQALLWAQRLVRIRPEHASHWVLLGDVLRRGGNLDAARRSYVRGLTVQPSWTTAQRRLDELGETIEPQP